MAFFQLFMVICSPNCPSVAGATNDAQHQTGDQKCKTFQTTFHKTVPPKKLFFLFKNDEFAEHIVQHDHQYIGKDLHGKAPQCLRIVAAGNKDRRGAVCTADDGNGVLAQALVELLTVAALFHELPKNTDYFERNFSCLQGWKNNICQ